MKIGDIIHTLEKVAHPSLQEGYDNAGLLTGYAGWDCTGVICSLDATEAVVLEAKAKGCNLVVAHHPIIFGGLKKITGKDYVEKTVIAAIKNDIAIYAIHTNLDNVIQGVNDTIADKLGLINRSILMPKPNQLMKLFTFVPLEYAEKVRAAIFEAGGGNIGNYSECSFNAEGKGTFKAGEGTHPFVGQIDRRHEENETKMEVVFPNYLQSKIVTALLKAHPYEEPAYDIIGLENKYGNVGSGLVGELPEEMNEGDLLNLIKKAFSLKVIKHTALLHKNVKKIAVCGGAGSFLIGKALAESVDLYITSDIKYHEFFDANGRMVVADIGHWESEQFTIDLLFDILLSEFPTFAVLKTGINTNPVHYFL